MTVTLEQDLATCKDMAKYTWNGTATPETWARIASYLERLKALERVAANVLLDEPHEVHDISPARVSRRAWKELQDAVGSKP